MRRYFRRDFVGLRDGVRQTMFESWASWTLRHERPCPRGRPSARGSASGRAPAARLAAVGVPGQQPDRRPWRCYSYFTADPFLVVRSQAVASSLPVRRGGPSWRPTLTLPSAPAAPLLGGSGAEPAAVLGWRHRLFRLRHRPAVGAGARHRRRRETAGVRHRHLRLGPSHRPPLR